MAEQKIIDKIKALLLQAESEKGAQIDSGTGERMSDSFAGDAYFQKAQELLNKHHLSIKDITLGEKVDPDFIPPIMGKSIVPNPFVRVNAKQKVRMLWFEELAKIVAEGFFCKARVEQGDVWFYGLDLDREIAILMFSKIAQRAKEIHDIEFTKLKSVVGAARIQIGKKKDVEPLPRVWEGDKQFTDSFHKGFRESLAQSFLDNMNGNSEAFQKALKDVEEYMFNTPEERNRDWRYTWNSIPDVTIELASWQYVINIGRKYGSRISKKVNSIAAQSTNEQLTISEQKGFVGEVYALLDNSASMQEREKLAQLKDGIKTFAIEATEKGQAVGLIKFGEGATHLIKPQLNVDKTFQAAVNGISANEGATEMIPALKLAQQYFRNTRVKRTIILVTDGSPTDYEGRDKVLEVAADIKRTGIEILTIGCGGANEDFLKQLASDSKGELVAENDLRNGMKRMAGLLSA